MTRFCTQPHLIKDNKKSRVFHRRESQVENYLEIMPSEEGLRKLEISTWKRDRWLTAAWRYSHGLWMAPGVLVMSRSKWQQGISAQDQEDVSHNELYPQEKLVCLAGTGLSLERKMTRPMERGHGNRKPPWERLCWMRCGGVPEVQRTKASTSPGGLGCTGQVASACGATLKKAFQEPHHGSAENARART